MKEAADVTLLLSAEIERQQKDFNSRLKCL